MKFLLGFLIPFLPLSTVNADELTRSQHLMGTLCEITTHGAEKDALNESTSKAFKEIRRIENRISTYIENSELSELNRSAGTNPIIVSDELFYLITKAEAGWNSTRGAFDAALHPVIQLWKNEPNPTRKQIKKALSQSGMKKIRITPDTKEISYKNNHVGLNFGGFGKGYALDQAKLVLLEEDIDSFRINFGGQIVVWHKNEEDRPTPILIRHPTNPNQTVAQLLLYRGSIATSSQQFQKHILNPKTGRPLETNASVTIVSNTSIDADLFATAALVMDENPSEDLCFIRVEEKEGQVAIESSRACNQYNLTEVTPSFPRRRESKL